MSLQASEVDRLIDFKNGQVSRDLFVNEDLYKLEQEKIFAKAWLYIGHESQIPNPGDFFMSRMGEESVILTRDRTRRIRVFLNSCRHRGMRVCRYDEGHTSVFYCPYHGWSYGIDGQLKNVTQGSTAYGPDFDKSEWGLVEVAKTATLKGTIWATWDSGASSFDEYLGDAKDVFDTALSAWDGDGETELLGSTQKWVIPSNWKIVSENFIGDLLHNPSHQSVDKVGIGPNGEGRRDITGFETVLSSYEQGHGVIGLVYPENEVPGEYEAHKATRAYFRDRWHQRMRNLGKMSRRAVAVSTIFPNMSLHSQQPRTILVAHPSGVRETEMWRVYFVDKAAPQEVKDYLRSYYIRYSGPAGMTEQDDMENWNYATSAGLGVIARRHDYNYKAGLNMVGKHEMFLGRTTTTSPFTEENARGMYARWAKYMMGDVPSAPKMAVPA
ncbi:aromatic ring-hydroxylating oxygenase subunit alpha (plasmid) [Sphingobium limneticum]|jgi:phenylpropionate dioxygenase-like ring-hydroxylating dioxygenase large terminal subunit|uniref:aromatic ring-hydroxylating oxygenase subunit alpha n=1 Tax=Nitrobacter sp. TaxID=29420 RepID=UPI000F7BA663|nr:aromatic ring-hydroxylating dioxygenase subunit alpha [Nitrobacter sp.]MCH2220200.1 aromatic ring-hydroxylating dioxygenase subunit alpha [Dechloromonas sp.]QEH80911.1 aromatic ring-hydroxylating dioxygenase subunit alpha [Sphingomonas sp. C8-2]